MGDFVYTGWGTGAGQLRGPALTRSAPCTLHPTGPAVEAAVCRVVFAPLKPALWTRLRTLRAQELRRLRRRQIALRAGAGPEGQSPAPALRSRIHARLAHLHAACSPRRKVALLLAVCSDVYAGLARGENQGKGGAGRLPGRGVARGSRPNARVVALRERGARPNGRCQWVLGTKWRWLGHAATGLDPRLPQSP